MAVPLPTPGPVLSFAVECKTRSDGKLTRALSVVKTCPTEGTKASVLKVKSVSDGSYVVPHPPSRMYLLNRFGVV